MATFWEIAAHSIDHMFLFVIIVISRFGFEDRIWVLIASVPDLCIHFTFSFNIVHFGFKGRNDSDWSLRILKFWFVCEYKHYCYCNFFII